MDLDVLLSYLYDNAPEVVQQGSRTGLKQGLSSLGLSPGLDYLSQQSGDLFKPMSFEDDEDDVARKAKIAEMFRAKEAAAADAPDPNAQQAGLDKLIEAGKRASGQREFMQGTEPLVEDYGKGIAIGGDPSRGSKDEIIARIRAQAAKMAGREGPSAGGGGFSQGTMTPQILQREAERDAWANNQPMRDAEFAMTPGQSARRPADADRAAGTLSNMQKNQAIQREQAMQSKLIDALRGSGGKIPFDQAMQLQASGKNLPYGSIGMSREDAMASFDAMIQKGGEDLAGINPLDAVGDESVKNRVLLTRQAIVLAGLYKQKVAAGMDPDEADRMLKEQVSRMMMEAGFLNTNEMVGPAPEAQ